MTERRSLAREVRMLLAGALIASAWDATAQASRDQALASLRAAADAGDVHAQVALGGLLDPGGRERNDDALRWYERAARAGDRVGRQRYLEMMSRPATRVTAPPTSFFIQLPRGETMDGGVPPQPSGLPPGYHCHWLGNGRMWCHGGSDAGGMGLP